MADDRDQRGADEDVDEAAEAGSKGSKGGKVKWWLIGGGVLLVLALNGALVWYLLFAKDPAEPVQDEAAAAAEASAEAGEEDGDAGPPRNSGEPPRYKSMEPALTVNFSEPSSSGRFLQVVVQVMARDQAVIQALDDNMPAARNDLIMLLGEQDPVALRTREGKEALQKEVLDSLRKVLEREAPGGGSLTQRRNFARGLEAVYFTTFVIQ